MTANAMKRLGASIVLLVVVAAVWGGAFLVASSLALANGFPTDTALAFGLFAFPVGPLVANVVAELVRWRRRAAERGNPKRPGLTTLDRWLLRTTAIDVLVVVVALVAAWNDTTSALEAHATWWLRPWRDGVPPRTADPKHVACGAPRSSAAPSATAAPSGAQAPAYQAPVAPDCIDGR